MAPYSDELRQAAVRLVAREITHPGESPDQPLQPRVRRSLSTSYDALFHFLTEEAGLLVVGADARLLARRNMLARTFTHRGLRLALEKVSGAGLHPSIAQFLASSDAPRPTPAFARAMAAVSTFKLDARTQTTI